jgi:hypothetical protein
MNMKMTTSYIYNKCIHKYIFVVRNCRFFHTFEKNILVTVKNWWSLTYGQVYVCILLIDLDDMKLYSVLRMLLAYACTIKLETGYINLVHPIHTIMLYT